MEKSYLQLEKAAVGYAGKALISGIEIGVKKGEIVTLAGPNGSGKSTILKSITRQLALVGGDVLLDGRPLAAYSPQELAKKMAVVLTAGMRPELMTCRDVAAMGRYPYTGRLGILSGEDERKVDAALQMVNAGHLAERPYDEVSDGERQRILLARAICQEPEIIVLDEPTSFLDIRHKLDLLSILQRMAREQGITVVMSLHEIDLAMKISDRVICVKGASIYACGKPEEVLRDETIRDLYNLESASYDALTGSVEMAAPAGQPQILVLSSCGRGIPVYRRLQRQGKPFAAGVVYTNDLDYPAAVRLSAHVITAEPFAPVSDAVYSEAMEWVEKCGRVIDAGLVTEGGNRRLADLLQRAEELGKLESTAGKVWTV